MEKILKKYTTIPEHLYVDRSADTQLKRIIEDMQRPGYVLVARQMGKTNLLFNAKRKLENKDRLFAYVDLSNVYLEERDCYRNVIDNIIEPNMDLFEDTLEDIGKIRDNDLPPHNEYSRCLRAILKTFKGNLVIVLDEIDALRSVDYSDNIFAQIRSNYFSRTNFPEFERLTYVLSGVIEPTELIKDPNKSPFNIGDKIYLDDFTENEHEDFIEKSKLDIDQSLSNAIFNWTNGNPRITFDVCSELENHILDGKKADRALLNSIIKKKYLTTFDLAPIDHIRELVKANKQIRTSVSLILRGESSEVSDEIKRKLYLYGIIDSRFDRETKIKNKIIEQSLSEDWIKSIDKLSTDSFNYGLERMDSNDYAESISSLLNFLETSEPTNFELEICNYNLGFAYYETGNYSNAIDYFSRDYSQQLYRANAFSLLGSAKIALGKLDEGQKILEKVIASKTNDFAYRNALLNLSTILSRSDSERALLLYEALYESTLDPKDKISNHELNQLKTLSLYHQAEIYLINSPEKALEKIDEALKFAALTDALFLLFFKYKLKPAENEHLKEQLVNTIITNNLLFVTLKAQPISFSRRLLYYFLDFVFDSSNTQLFEQLLHYSESRLLPDSNKCEIIFDTALVANDNKAALLSYLLQFEKDCEENFLINVYREFVGSSLEDKENYFKVFDKYLKLFIETDEIITKDIYIFAQNIKILYNLRRFDEAIKLCKIIEPELSKIKDENSKLESLIIHYWFALSYFAMRDRYNARKYADEGLFLIASSNKKATSVLDEKGLLSIADQLNQVKYSTNINEPIVNNKKYGRNDKIKVRYPDGREIETKYKKLEADILAGRCTIIQ